MHFNYTNYCQYLLNAHTNYTITNLANHLERISHDTINRYLRTETLSFLRTAAQTQDLWHNVQK